MTIAEIRADKVLELIIRTYLQTGVVPTIEQISAEFDIVINTSNLSLPSFDYSEFRVNRDEESSATKFNRTNNTIKEDLDIVFRSLFVTTDKAVKLFDRWESKADKLENRVIGLEGRIARLLSLAQDTEGYFDIVGDTFTDTSLIDQDLSFNISINLSQNLITMAKSTGISAFVDRIFLNDLLSPQVKFSLLQQNNVVSVAAVDNTEPRFAFRDENRYWKTHVYTNKRVAPLTAELTLALDTPTPISKIQILLHTSEQNSTTSITPLYSSDGINFFKVPSANTILESLNKMEFSFPEVMVLKLKLIIQKNGHDFITSDNLFGYEFGAKEIALYREAFSNDSDFKGKVVTKPLSITQPDGTFSLFNRITLDVCEVTSTDTFIDYFVAVGKNDNGVPRWLTSSGFVTSPSHIVGGQDQRLWTPIAPANRTEVTHPQVLDFATISNLEQTNVGISYDKDGGSDFESPARPFILLQQNPSGEIYETPCQSKSPVLDQSDLRYFLARPGHKLLNVQIDKATDIDTNNLTLWRNVGEKGIDPLDTMKRVRGVQVGWEFIEPYYITNIQIEGSQGLTINFGDNPITIDQVSHVGVVGPDILSQGNHKVKVHKDYWRALPPNLTSLQNLKGVDILYPYNQKMLIEGYQYDATYPSDDEQIYVGVDRFAGIVGTRVGVFDIINNVANNDFSKYAIDTDAPGASEVIFDSSDAPLSYVIVLNTKNEIADFMNEKFVLEFNLTDELFSFVALKAELRTSNNQISPIFDEYRIKLAV